MEIQWVEHRILTFPVHKLKGQEIKMGKEGKHEPGHNERARG
jgi:hypothetical protein